MIDNFSKLFLFPGAAIFIFLLIIAAPRSSYAQEDGRSRYEKDQERIIKWNRKRLKSQRSRRARRTGSFLNFGTSKRQGDQPYQGNALSRSNRKRISPSSTPSVYAQPDPYSFRRGSRKRKIYSNDRFRLTPRSEAKAWKGTIAGGVGSKNPASSRPKIYAQPDPYKHRSGLNRRKRIYSNDQLKSGSPSHAKAWKGDIAGNTFKSGKGPGGKINVYPRVNPYRYRKLQSESDLLSRNQTTFGTTPQGEKPPKRKRIKPRSASGRYAVNRRANPYRLRGRHGWENTYTGGFYGRRSGIKPRDNQQVSSEGNKDPYRNRGRLGDKPYKGAAASGGYKSTPRNPQRAWKGDIAGQPIKTNKPKGDVNVHPRVNPYGNRLNRSEGDRISRRQDFYGATPRSTQRPSNRRKVKINSATRGYIVRRKAKPYKLRDVKKWEETYTGGFYGRREGVSPRDNQRVSSVAARDPYAKRGKLGDKPYSGEITGGWKSATKRKETPWQGDIAGRTIERTTPRDNQQVGKRYGRPRKMLSISGKAYNNNGNALPKRYDDKNTRSIGGFTGNIRSWDTPKGGGSLPRNSWNNNGSALSKRYDDKDTRAIGGFSGNIKSSSTPKGGGSIARNDWNNNYQPLAKKYDSRETRMAGSFSGNVKSTKQVSGGGSLSRNDWNNKGQALPNRYERKEAGSFSGSVKASKPEKGGGSNTREVAWNNNGSSLNKRSSNSASYESARYSGDIKQKRSALARNKKTDDDALMVRKPTRSYFAAGNFRGTKKDKRKVDGQTHSSTKFFNSKETSNAVEEKKKFISFKLLWNKLFGKDVAENGDNARRPRYDRREKGIWYE